MTTNTAIKVCANNAQLKFLQSDAEFKIGVWGRATGKTTTFGMQHYRRLLVLPQAKFFLTSSTYKQILNNCLPAMIAFWQSVGLEEYDVKSKRGHYVIGQKPPSHFAKPYQPPQKYEHIITFWNGYTIEMLTMDRPSPNRGPSYDGGDADELALIKRNHLMENLMPAIRGNVDKYGKGHPLHGKFSGFTSRPWLSTGEWVHEYEAKAAEDPVTYFYSEANASCNLAVLGPDWIDKQSKFLTPEIFDIEILNNKRTKSDTQFYPSFNDTRHVYEPKTSYITDPAGRGLLFEKFHDYDPGQLLDISWDVGGWFTGALVFQQSHDPDDTYRVTEKMINSFFVLKEGSVDDVVDQIVNHYSGHRMKIVRLYGEPRANDPSGYGLTLYQKIQARFIHHGWTAELMVFQSQADSHDVRYVYLNEVLGELHAYPKLRINRETCKSPIIAIQRAGRTHDGKKDKSDEKDRNFDQKIATHWTDALDYYYMQKHYHQAFGMGLSAWTG